MLNSLRIVRGARDALARDAALRPTDRDVCAPAVDGAVPRAFGALRALLPTLRARRGAAAVEGALDAHRTWLSLTLPGLSPRLTDAERARQHESAADPDGFLSHNNLVSTPLFDAWVDALRPLLADPTLCVSLVDATAHDPDSVAALVAAWSQTPPEARFDLRLGAPTDEAPFDPLWSASAGSVRAQLEVLSLRPDVVVSEVDARGGLAPWAPDAGAPLDPLDGDPEGHAARALAATPVDVPAVMDTLRTLFRGFGFDAALRLGLALLDRGDALDAAARAELHALVALSAYNRQVETAGNAALTAFLGEHFAAALAHEPDAGRRSHLRYRLCINAGRRAGALVEALAEGDAAVREARDPSVSPDRAAFLEAWARNGRAYVLARLDRLDEARDDMQAAWELARAIAPSASIPRAERAYSLVVLLDNSAELALRAGDLAAARVWQERLAEAEASLIGGARFAPWRWSSIHLRAHAPRALAAQAREGLRAARRALDPVAEDAFLMMAGDACYRCGDVADALAHFDDARRIRRRAESPAQLRAVELNRALAALRAGAPDVADGAVEGALALCGEADGALRAELLALLALSAALRGDGERADAVMNDAVAGAVATGSRDLMLRVARRAGEACAALGRDGAAAQAFEQSLRLGGVGDTPPPAVDVASALLSLHALGAADDGAVSEATALLAGALDDADAWWELARWERALAAGAALDGDVAEGAATLRAALAAR